MKIQSKLRNSIVTGALLLLCACGGSDNKAATPVAVDTVVKGVAQAGTFVGATVKIYGYNAAGALVQLTTTPAAVVTGADGSYQADVGSYTGAVVVKVFGSFHDEASNSTITIPEANALQAGVAAASGTVSIPVTPLTDLAVRKAADAGSIKDNIAASNQAISTLFGFDIIATTPVAPTSVALGAAGVTDNQKKYTTELAALSQYVANSAALPAAPTATELQNALTQIGAGITLTGTTAQVASPQVALGLQQAAAGLAGNANTQAVVTAAGSAGQTALTGLATVGNATGSKILAIRVKTVGSYSGTIIGSNGNLTLPAGATLRVDGTGATLLGVVAASGNAAGGSAAGKVTASALNLGVILGSGFGVGEFATIYCDVPAASTLTAADFSSVTNVKTSDLNGAAIAGITMAAF